MAMEEGSALLVLRRRKYGHGHCPPFPIESCEMVAMAYPPKEKNFALLVLRREEVCPWPPPAISSREL